MTSCRWKPQSFESLPAKWNKVETNSAPHFLNPFHFSNEENKSSGPWLREHGRNQKNDIIKIIYYHSELYDKEDDYLIVHELSHLVVCGVLTQIPHYVTW